MNIPVNIERTYKKKRVKLKFRILIRKVCINPLMHNVYKWSHFRRKNHLLLKYLLTCDYFVKVCIKGLMEGGISSRQPEQR